MFTPWIFIYKLPDLLDHLHVHILTILLSWNRLHSFALDTLAKRATMDRLSDHEILYSVLGGLQPGGTCLAWIAGLIACESLRLTQRFDEETSWDKRFFVYFSLLMSVTLAGLFAAMLYHYCIGSYGNYHNLLHVTNVVRFHYIFARVATCGGEEILILRAFCVGLWAWESQDLQGARRQSVHCGPGGGPVRGYCPRNPSGIHHTDFPNSCGSWVFWDMVSAAPTHSIFFILAIGVQQKLRPIVFGPRGRVVQLICGALLTLLKACDLARSKAVRQMLVSNQDLLRYVSSILCLLCQTAIFPTIFDLVSLYLRNAKGAGIGYTMMSLSAELHLFGPIMAISATLQEDFLADQASTCSIGNTECKAVVPPTTKKLTFQTQEKRIMKGN
ncbi:hypothetical protein KEM48_005159 [Puccinia striiformis f. sp. tritici PST-130]|nr:hypothetical protein KEM48_005159 [Puccinia striiformis f. sp. tritici PST-130]